MACTYTYKGKQYTEEELSNLPEFKSSMLPRDQEREYIIRDTGPNSNEQIHFSPTPNATGVFVKFIEFKNSQIRELEQRLDKAKRDQRNTKLSTAELQQLKNLERDLKFQLEGNFELGIKGLRLEVAELQKAADINAVTPYIEKDLDRLEKLAQSNNPDDLREAQRLVDFYDLAGTFSTNQENPFFTEDEIFLSDMNGNITSDYRLPDSTMQVYRDWRNRALASQNVINKKFEDATVNQINGMANSQKINGGNLSFKEITKSDTGLKDADWFSMWAMDITQGVFSTNGIIPQAMFSYMADSLEKKLSWARKIEEKIDKLNPGVQKELIKLGYSLRGAGILGINGASFQIFKEITREGNETGGIVQRYVKEFFDAEKIIKSRFSDDFTKARISTDPYVREQAINRAFENLKKWRRNNTTILDISKVPELMTTVTPEAEAYKKELIGILGDKGYKEQVAKQQQLLKDYEAERLSHIDTVVLLEGVADYNALSAKGKDSVAYWESNQSPSKGIEDFNTVNGIFHGNKKTNNLMNYNVLIPRKFKASIINNNGKLSFANTTTETGYFDSNFSKIENNPILSEYYDVIKEVTDTIRENMPYDLQQKMAANTMPALTKTSTEIIADKNNGAMSSLWLSFKHLIERIRIGFGIIKQSDLSYATVDPVTGRTNYKVNDQFLQGNLSAVRARETIERAKFIQSYGRTIDTIKAYSVFPLDTMPMNTLYLLAEYLHLNKNSPTLKADIKAKTGPNVYIGKYIRDFSLHSVVQSQSFDLSKIAKYYSNITMAYAARQEALPILEIMKKHYEGIKKPKTNNIGSGIRDVNSNQNLMDGFRTGAIKQMDDWFERVVLNNYGTKSAGIHGATPSSPKLQKINDRLAEIETKLGRATSTAERDKLLKDKERLLIRRAVPNVYGRDIYTDEEKKRIAEIETLLETERNIERRAELIQIKERMGRVRTSTALIDNIYAWIRTLRLGYNLSSATTNFLEGMTSNMIVGSMGEYFDPKEIYYGYGVVKSSFLKNLTFGAVQTPMARKNRILMDKFNVIMDSKNELQKSTVRTYASKFSWMAPHELNQRVEFVNQSPVMIAMLRTQKITGKDGTQSSVWDAMDKDGKLTDNFKTTQNVENWEELTGKDYLNFKQKLHKAIVMAHGNYDELRGMMIKSGSVGKGLAMFKTWLPMQIYQRFAVEQDDLQAGTKGFKGRYLSYGTGSAAIHGAAVAGIAFGPFGFLVGAAIGAGLGKFGGQADTGIGMLRESVETLKQLGKKSIGMPVNLLAGKQLINMDNDFDKWIGQGSFTANDAKAMRANMADISLQLAWLGFILMVKSLLWDDDDKPEDPRRKAHNILIGRLMSLSSSAAQYVNPPDMYNLMLGNNAVPKYAEDIGKLIVAVGKYIEGDDTVISGQNAGESNLANQASNTILPGIFKDNMLGFKKQSEKVFEESAYHPYFRSEATKEKQANQRDRAERRIELESEGIPPKDILKQLNEELPTPGQLKKKGLTREEYEANR